GGKADSGQRHRQAEPVCEVGDGPGGRLRKGGNIHDGPPLGRNPMTDYHPPPRGRQGGHGRGPPRFLIPAALSATTPGSTSPALAYSAGRALPSPSMNRWFSFG